MGKDWLLLSSGGCFWGVPRSRVRKVKTSGDGYTVDLDTAVLAAEDVVSFAPLAGMTRTGPVLGSVAPAGCVGLALHGERPVVVIDPGCPPAALLADPNEAHEGSAGELHEDDHNTG